MSKSKNKQKANTGGREDGKTVKPSDKLSLGLTSAHGFYAAENTARWANSVAANVPVDVVV